MTEVLKVTLETDNCYKSHRHSKSITCTVQ